MDVTILPLKGELKQYNIIKASGQRMTEKKLRDKRVEVKKEKETEDRDGKGRKGKGPKHPVGNMSHFLADLG